MSSADQISPDSREELLADLELVQTQLDAANMRIAELDEYLADVLQKDRIKTREINILTQENRKLLKASVPANDGHTDLLKKITRVGTEFVDEVMTMRMHELQRRVLIQKDWLVSYSICLDGLNLLMGVESARNPQDIRRIVESFQAAVASLPPPARLAEEGCPVSDAEYTKNMLGGISDWLITRSTTCWAREFHYESLMHDWGRFLRRYLNARHAEEILESLRPAETSAPPAKPTVIDGLEQLLKRESDARVRILPDGSVVPWDAGETGEKQ
jgi:hypothetical protein